MMITGMLLGPHVQLFAIAMCDSPEKRWIQ